MEIGDRRGEAAVYRNLVTLFKKLDDKFDKTQEYHEKALAIRVEIKGRRAEAADYGI